jgi:hypothetical protein
MTGLHEMASLAVWRIGVSARRGVAGHEMALRIMEQVCVHRGQRLEAVGGVTARVPMPLAGLSA